ncbi:MAG: peptide deformylase [Nitrospina sp.]|jgi:peptide deformylase|nr:peptide deformylase [Nitrospina sp.]MBT6718890.1 peptide deformylase [Nitrospina sp.]
MAKLEILVYPDERLRQVSKLVKAVNNQIVSFISDLEETLSSLPGCVGIAAPQVGRFERIIIVDVSARPQHKNHGHLVLINPVITSNEGNSVGREGCLSVPDYTGKVSRSKYIVVKAQDGFGSDVTYSMEGYEARAVQHEIDHLNGKLFIDSLVGKRNNLKKRTDF